MFDENYNETYYRAETAKTLGKTMDCLIVIGTSLETSFASNFVTQAAKNGVLIVEINPEPCIQEGNCKQLIARSQDIVPDLCLGLKTLIKTNPK